MVNKGSTDKVLPQVNAMFGPTVDTGRSNGLRQEQPLRGQESGRLGQASHMFPSIHVDGPSRRRAKAFFQNLAHSSFSFPQW